jgi:hypothetical protein
MYRGIFLSYLLCSIALFGLFACDDDPADPVNTTGRVVVNGSPDHIAFTWILNGPGDSSVAGAGDSTLTDMPAGAYALVWGDLEGWITPQPAPHPSDLAAGGLITFAAEYLPEAQAVGTVEIDPEPDALNASWTLTGPDKITYNGQGDSTMIDLPIGSYTIAWGIVIDHTAPPGRTRTLEAESTLVFNGLYQPVTVIDDEIAYLKDDPNPGAENEFSELVAALAWLEGRLDYEDPGTLVWQTDTAQDVETLDFTFDLTIEVAAGRVPVLQGPAAGALTINAAGALGLDGFEILAPNGFILNANRNINVSGCTLPESTTINVGGVAGAPFPAADPGYAGRSAKAIAKSGGALIAANTFGANMSVVFVGGVSISALYTLKDNGGENLNVGGTTPLGTGAIVDVCMTPAAPSPVPIPYPTITTILEGDAQVKVRGLKQIKTLILKPKTNGNNTVTLEKLTGTTGDIAVAGSGTARVIVSASELTSHKFLLDSSSVRVEIDTLKTESMLIDTGADKAVSSIEMEARDLEMSGAIEADFSKAGGASVSMILEDPELQDFRMYVTESQDLDLTINDGTAEGMFYVGKIQKSDARVKGAAAGGGITLNGMSWTGTGFEHVDINSTGAAVTITDCDFSFSGDPALALGLTEVSGVIGISSSTFTNLGIGLVDCQGSTSINDSQITVTASAGYGVSMGNSAAVTIQSTSINSSGAGCSGVQTADMLGDVSITGGSLVGGTLALLVGNSNVTCDSNEHLSGMISIIEGQLHISGNTCSGVFLVDDYLTPGLQNDPVADNDGLLPGEVMTRMDWDGNGCCDYPPEWNIKEDGVCACWAAGKSLVGLR